MQIFSYLCSAKEIAKVNPADGQRAGTMVVQVCNRGCGTLWARRWHSVGP